MDNQPLPPEMAFRCPKSWDGMKGNDQRRFCDQCQLHVVNLSALPRRAGERLLARRGERLCVTYLSSADGTMLTASRWRWLTRSAAVMRGGLMAALALFAPLFFGSCTDHRRTTGTMVMVPSNAHPSPTPPVPQRTAGMVACPPKR